MNRSGFILSADPVYVYIYTYIYIRGPDMREFTWFGDDKARICVNLYGLVIYIYIYIYIRGQDMREFIWLGDLYIYIYIYKGPGYA